MAHGAMERTFQKSVLAGIFSDMEFNTVDKCGGHDYATAKNWLSGFHFPDDTIQAQKLSNQALTAILDPSSDSYRDLINFVYDTSAIEECDGSEDWFA